MEICNNEKKLINILHETNTYTTNLVGAFFEVALLYKFDIKIPHDIITVASQQSGLLTLGALLLEESLSDDSYHDQTHHDDEEPPSKRIAGTITNTRIDYWIKLSE